MKSLSLAIPHFNASSLVQRSLEYAATDERISEVVINDDCSSRAQYAALLSLVSRLGNKFKLSRNNHNLGILANKLAAVSRCANEWAILLDADNVVDRSYFDALYALDRWSSDTIYCPQFARPKFDFRDLAGSTIDRSAAATILQSADTPRWFRTFLNTGNYLVPVRRYVECVAPYRQADVKAADVIFVAYLWLLEGGRLHVVPGLEYDHRLHCDSSSTLWASLDPGIAREIGHALATDQPFRPHFHGAVYTTLLRCLSGVGLTRRHFAVLRHAGTRIRTGTRRALAKALRRS